MLGGRDLVAGGTWLALNAAGRLALVTNVREPGRFDTALPSRGELVTLALGEQAHDSAWLSSMAQTPRNGFNLVVAELAGDGFTWVGNRPAQCRRETGGVWGLSNAALDTPWPKVERLKQRLKEALASQGSAAALAAAAFVALGDRAFAADPLLPATGVPLERERQLSPAFIHIAAPAAATVGVYGTRCSTVVIVERLKTAAGERRVVHVFERSFDRLARSTGDVNTRLALPN